MTKPHGRDCPNCSLCLGAVPKRIEQSADVILVNGEPVRAIASPESDRKDYSRRGKFRKRQP